MREYICELEDARYEMEWTPKEEIVRCCYCKHHEYMSVSYSDKPLSVCLSEQWIGAEGDNPLVKPDGFCAWGEKRGE